MRPIIVRFNDTAGQWNAFFEGAPMVSFGGRFSMEAVHRLLDGLPAGDVEMHIEQADGSTLPQSASWQPPELLSRCPTCGGKGEYVGLNTREPCEACAGRGMIVV